MSELLRPIFEETDDVHELQQQRALAIAYLGEVSVALCHASVENNHIISTIIGLNMKLRQHGVCEPALAQETSL